MAARRELGPRGGGPAGGESGSGRRPGWPDLADAARGAVADLPPRARAGLSLRSVQACGVASGAARPLSVSVHSGCSDRAHLGGGLLGPAGSPCVTSGAVCLFCDKLQAEFPGWASQGVQWPWACLVRAQAGPLPSPQWGPELLPRGVPAPGNPPSLKWLQIPQGPPGLQTPLHMRVACTGPRVSQTQPASSGTRPGGKQTSFGSQLTAAHLLSSPAQTWHSAGCDTLVSSPTRCPGWVPSQGGHVVHAQISGSL